jgi:hypothetical protein
MQIQDRFVRVEWIDDSQEIHQIEFAFDMRLSEAHAIERAKKEANNYIENGVIVKVSAYVAEPYLLTWELRQELTCEKILTDLLGTVAKDRGEYKLLFDWAEDLGLANLTYCYVVTPSGDVFVRHSNHRQYRRRSPCVTLSRKTE